MGSPLFQPNEGRRERSDAHVPYQLSHGARLKVLGKVRT